MKLKAPSLFLSMAAVAISLSSSGCEVGPQFTAQQKTTSTITLVGQRSLLINSALSTTILGERRLNEVEVELDARVSATSSATAHMLAAELEVVEDDSDPTVLSLTLPMLQQASLDGTLIIKVPKDLPVVAIQRSGTLDVIDVQESININAISHVRVTGAERDVSVAIEQGNALVETRATPGTQTIISVGSGSIELTVPLALSANIEAAVGTAGAIIPNHPALSPWVGGGLPYLANVNGGLSVFRLSTRSGNIVIRTP